MNPAQLRLFLNMAVGLGLDVRSQVDGGNALGPLFMGLPSAALNGTRQMHLPVIATTNLAGGALQIRNDPVGGNGRFLPDFPNQCTRTTSTGSGGILISGRFNGCTFLRWQDPAGVLHVGHVFVDALLAGNNPAAQIAAFRADLAVAPGAVVSGFSTIGQLAVGGQYGYVIALQMPAGWEYHWTSCSAAGVVVATRQLVAADWAAH